MTTTEDIKRRRTEIVAALRAARVQYDNHVAQLMAAAAKLQAECARLGHGVIKYHPDASGNNDWSEECLACGQDDKYLVRYEG